MGTALFSAVVGLVFAASSADAQDFRFVDDPAAARATEAPLPRSLWQQAERPGGANEPEFGLIAGLHGRYAIPFGSASRDVSGVSGPGGAFVFVDQHVSWNDLFDPGWGWELEATILLGSSRERGQSTRWGFYIAVMEDQYSGDRVTDSFGASVKADDINVGSILVGGKAVYSMGHPWFADGRFGLGAVHYSSVDGTFSAPLGLPFRSELFEDTWTFAMEFRGHVGVRLGPIHLVAGLGLRFQLPPSEGTFANLDSGPFWVFDLDLGVELGL